MKREIVPYHPMPALPAHTRAQNTQCFVVGSSTALNRHRANRGIRNDAISNGRCSRACIIRYEENMNREPQKNATSRSWNR